MKINVVKIGGAVVEDGTALALFLKAFAAMEGLKILVHGGGRTASNVCGKLGIRTVMSGGRRITDGDTLKVVTAVYAGLVNKDIVARLQAEACKPLLQIVRSVFFLPAERGYGNEPLQEFCQFCIVHDFNVIRVPPSGAVAEVIRTLWTPAFRAENALSSFGSMPPLTIPSSFSEE